jgi:hypothetical protein
LESLAKCLRIKGLCDNYYLIASCSLHAIQLVLSNPVKAAFGEGDIEKANLLQMLHSVYDLQECVELGEFRGYFKQARSWSKEFLHVPYTAEKHNDFSDAWALVKSFCQFSFVDVMHIKEPQKVPAPVLTRWWYVGVAANYLWHHFLVVFRLTQTIINLHGSDSKPNKIASGLQSMMRSREFYTDLCFMRGFHLAFMNNHFKWLQDTDDLTKHHGFWSHHMLTSYFIMSVDLKKIKNTLFICHEHFAPF